MLSLTGCQVAQNVDAALRRVDVLDRVFEPGRFRTPPPPPEAPPEPETLAKAPGPEPEPVQAEAAPVTAPAPEPAPEPVQAAAPSAATLLRRNPWLSRFWGELTPAQQARVARRMPGGASPEAWDRMGLGERVRLVYGVEGG
jgi:outer membrane biosynthesis protein TonB